jgi:hypothetical protein
LIHQLVWHKYVWFFLSLPGLDTLGLIPRRDEILLFHPNIETATLLTIISILFQHTQARVTKVTNSLNLLMTLHEPLAYSLAVYIDIFIIITGVLKCSWQ